MDILLAARYFGHDAWNKSESESMTESHISFSARDVQDLFATLATRTIPYLLVGGVALLKYIEGRNTRDIDLLITLQSLEKLPELTVIQEDRPVLRSKFRNVPVDIFLTEDPLFKLVYQRHATTHRFEEFTIHCATVEGLLLLKLYALTFLYRQMNTPRIALYETDILMLLDLYQPPVDPLLQTLAPFVEEGALAELRKIVEDIQVRIARTKRQ